MVGGASMCRAHVSVAGGRMSMTRDVHEDHGPCFPTMAAEIRSGTPACLSAIRASVRVSKCAVVVVILARITASSRREVRTVEQPPNIRGHGWGAWSPFLSPPGRRHPRHAGRQAPPASAVPSRGWPSRSRSNGSGNSFSPPRLREQDGRQEPQDVDQAGNRASRPRSRR